MVTRKKAKNPRGRQHDIRSATLRRIGADLSKLAKVWDRHNMYECPSLVFRELARLFAAAAKREGKLR